MTEDVVFIKKLVDRFEEKGITYCVLRNADEILTGDAHDIDMALDFSRYNDAYSIIKEVAGREWRIHFISERDNGNLVTIHLYKVENEIPLIVHFDFFRAFGWQGYKLIPYEQMLKGRKKIEWLYEASDAVKAVTMLFSRYLYHGYVKTKYRDFISSSFKNNTNDVRKLMSNFLDEDFIENIIDDVIHEEWENIEQECPVVRRKIRDILQVKQPNLIIKKQLFDLNRLKAHTGIVVCVNGNKTVSEYNEFASKLQNLLSRTFSEGDVVKNIRGGIRCNTPKDKLTENIQLSKGKLIFYDYSVNRNESVCITDTSEKSLNLGAIKILETMARRYS